MLTNNSWFRQRVKKLAYKSMNFSEATQLFLDSMIGIRSDKTVQWYRESLLSAMKVIGDVNVHNITITELRKYRVFMTGKTTKYGGDSDHPQQKGTLSPWTIHDRIKAVKRFFTWLHDEGHIAENPAIRLETPRPPVKPKPGVSDTDAEKMLRAVRGSARDYAIMVFVRDTGCRLGGVTNLKISGLDLDSKIKTAQVSEKGDQDRTVYISDQAADALVAWFQARPDWVNHDIVFTTYGGKPISEHGTYEIFRRAAEDAGVKKHWSPHEWRHRFAKKMIANGANLQQVSQILGHKKIGITSEFYGQLPDEEIAKAYKRYYLSPEEPDQ